MKVVLKDEGNFPPLVEEHIPTSLPQSIDYGLYQNAIDDRRQAEMSAAEIYSQYLKVMAFNQKLLRKQKKVEKFKLKVREVYERALNKNGSKTKEADRARRHQIGVEKALDEAQKENAALRASNRAHEEAFEEILRKLGQAESQMERANHQFQTLAEEFDNRGILLEEAERTIQGNRAQIDQLNASLAEWHDKYSKVRDQNLILQSEVRDIQLREAGVAALNSELASSATKAQKLIYELEDRLNTETEDAKTKIAMLEVELDRYREQKRVEALLEKSKKLQAGEKVVFIPDQVKGQHGNPKEQWNEFYQKWSHIINELTTHSNPMTRENTPAEPPLPPVPQEYNSEQSQLMSEAGELEII
jgi:chromosome segregation ATPase